MTILKLKQSVFAHTVPLFIWGIPFVVIGSIIFVSPFTYFRPYYTEEVYTHLRNLFDNSQYRQKNPTTLIADEIVFRYAAGAYVRGIDPILINSEITPLGKYIVGVSILFFKTDAWAIVLSAVLSLFAMWLISSQVISSPIVAAIPLALFSVEKLFLDQLRITPLMDIVQLPFILFTLFFFMDEQKRTVFLFTPLFLGLVMATKSVVPAIVLIGTFLAWFFLQKQGRAALRFMMTLPIAIIPLLLSYTRTFFDGYSVQDFIGFQKWILLYQQSKLILPLSFWKLVLLNHWQTWWGDRAIHQVGDWSLYWPLIVLLPFLAIIIPGWRYILRNQFVCLLFLWVFLYECFLSVGAVVTRFLLPLLPVLYILFIWILCEFFRMYSEAKLIHRKHSA